MNKKVIAVVIAGAAAGILALYFHGTFDRLPEPQGGLVQDEDNEARQAVLASLSEKPTVSEFKVAITKHGTRNVLWAVFYSDRFGYVLDQISTGNKEWYEIAKALIKESDAGASEQLDEAIAKAEEKVPGLDPTSPKVFFRGQATDSFSRDGETDALKVTLKKHDIPFTVQETRFGEVVSWPRKFTPQVRKIDERYYCDPDLPEYRTYEARRDFKECLVKHGIAFTAAVCHKQDMLVVTEAGVDRMLKEQLCRD